MKMEHGTRGFSLLADMAALDVLLGEEDNPMAVIVDPISAYQDPVGNNAKTHDSHKNTDVRSLLRPVSELVDRRNVTMILINHLTKGAGRAITRGQGNMAFVAGPRAVWQVSKDKDDPRKRLFLPVKNNLADDSEETGLSFTVEGVDLGFDEQGKAIKTSRISWNDERVTITADEAAGFDSMSHDERGSIEEASEFLRETLANGRVKVKDVERQAKGAGHSLSTLGRAKRALGIKSEREQFGGEFYWRLKELNPPRSEPPPSYLQDD
jgi:putative DNA primase/helicase